MTETIVTLRLSLADPAGVDMERVAAEFSAAGFGVERDGRRGFLLSGPKPLAEETFGAAIGESERGPQFITEPRQDTILRGIGFTVYFPTRPEFFSP